MPETYFNMVNNSVERIIDFYELLKNDISFQSIMKENKKLNILFDGGAITYPSDQVRTLFWADVIKCYSELGHPINLNTKEGLGLLIFILRTVGLNPIKYPNLALMPDKLKKSAEVVIRRIKPTIDLCNPSANNFLVAEILAKYDTELQKKYFVLLYRFTSITAKADGTISAAESRWLGELMKLNRDSGLHDKEEEIIESTTEEVKTSVHLPKPNPHEELQSLIGLNLVKSEISTLVNFIKIQQARESKGLKSSQLSYHCIFMGNPGTGKTTVARIVAEIYKDLGLLKKGHLVETDRSGLVAEYVGQTAVKTNKIIDSALDGILFIDEAYALISNSSTDFGKEAIATLLKRMEDDRDRLVVILAGYTNEMNLFINSNPGLKSRFNRYIDFADYSAEELYKIFELNLKNYEYTISEDAKETLKERLHNAVSKKDCNFGNGRFVRNLFEKTLERQANRLATKTNLTTEMLSEILKEDIG